MKHAALIIAALFAAPAAADLCMRLLLGQQRGEVAPEPYDPARFR